MSAATKDEEWEIEEVLAQRVKIQYLIKWKGHPPEMATWEDATDVDQEVIDWWNNEEDSPPGSPSQADTAGTEKSRKRKATEPASFKASKKPKISSPPKPAAPVGPRGSKTKATSMKAKKLPPQTSKDKAKDSSGPKNTIRILVDDNNKHVFSLHVKKTMTLPELREVLSSQCKRLYDMTSPVGTLLTSEGKELPLEGLVTDYYKNNDKVVVVFEDLLTLPVKMKDGELIKLMVNRDQKAQLEALSEKQRQEFAERQKEMMLKHLSKG